MHMINIQVRTQSYLMTHIPYHGVVNIIQVYYISRRRAFLLLLGNLLVATSYYKVSLSISPSLSRTRARAPPNPCSTQALLLRYLSSSLLTSVIYAIPQDRWDMPMCVCVHVMYLYVYIALFV